MCEGPSECHLLSPRRLTSRLLRHGEECRENQDCNGTEENKP